MSRRDHYPAGVPCFVDTITRELDPALRFYGAIFGWEFSGPGMMPDESPGGYFVARLHGEEVAGIGATPSAPDPAAWNTHVAVDSADDAAARAVDAGGSIVLEPFDAPPAGRQAVIADPAGAAFCVWEAGVRRGATRINEPSAWAMSLLGTSDVPGAVRFYGELFGWRAEAFGDPDSSAGIWLFRLPGYVGGEPGQPVPRDVVAAMLATAERPPAWSVDFWIADADAAAAHAAALGGSVVAAPHEEPMFRRAVLAAPDGATFSVSQLQPAG
ncbi:MAG: VOC family protein [Solirubrobacteraceae bacterium]